MTLENDGYRSNEGLHFAAHTRTTHYPHLSASDWYLAALFNATQLGELPWFDPAALPWQWSWQQTQQAHAWSMCTFSIATFFCPQLLLLLHLTTRSRRHGCTITRRNAQNERTDERFRNMIYSVWGSGFLSLQLILMVLNLLLSFPFFQHLINLLPSIPSLPACSLLGLPVYVCAYATWCSRLNALATFCERLMHPNIKQPLSPSLSVCGNACFPSRISFYIN